MEIFAPADEEQRANPHPWAVDDVETGALVGFAMISNNPPQPMDEDLIGPYYLWKLHIDQPLQGQGYGAATLDAVVDYLLTRPGADVLYTSCTDGPGSPRGFYLRYGSSLIPVATCGARTSWHSTSSHRLSNRNRLDLPARHRLRFTVDLGKVRLCGERQQPVGFRLASSLCLSTDS